MPTQTECGNRALAGQLMIVHDAFSKQKQEQQTNLYTRAGGARQLFRLALKVTFPPFPICVAFDSHIIAASFFYSGVPVFLSTTSATTLCATLLDLDA